MHCYLLINKPPGPTSHDVIDVLRCLTGIRRIGHAGTLDPFASGVLLVGVGREATKNLGKFVGLDKKYRVVLRLGAVSDTYDAYGVISKIKNQKLKITINKVKSILEGFVGKQKQLPPQYSAKKIGGRKAYELARKGQIVKLKEQDIEIYDVKLKTKNFHPASGRPKGEKLKTTTQNLKLENIQLTIDVHCSSGTYIRSLAHDIGQKLGCGAYAEELERTAIGNFELSEAVKLSKLTKDNWQKYLINFNTVMAAGTFEILHPGHQYFLKEAKKLGQKLFVVIARDKLAERLRGRKLRFDENERLDRVKKLEFVDQVMLGGARDLYQSIKKIKPDIIALGYDQKIDASELALKINKFGLKTKIARIGAHCPEKYKSSLLSSKYQ